MTCFQKGMISLVKSALDGSKAEISDGFDWGECITVALSHQILPLIYYGAHNSGLTAPDEMMSALEMSVFKAISVDQNQLYELTKIEKAFNENAIDYMPLKGVNIKYLYPKTEMRPMGDADILIRVEQYDKIKPIMEALGFNEGIESDHELIWKKKGRLFLELHKRLIPSYNKDYYAYFGDGWRLAKQSKNIQYRYEMSPEDTYIHLFTHFAKHYRDGGIGIRHLTDLWVYKNSFSGIDWPYVECELKKLSLYDFYVNITKTQAVWFENAKETEISDYITAVVFESGSFGTKEGHTIANGIKLADGRDIKKSAFLRAIFPNVSVMSKSYPILDKFPYLLPLMWVVRGFRSIFFHSERVKSQNKYTRLLTPDNIRNYQDSLKYVGLNFNFKEQIKGRKH